jgi:hypothetical protein
MNNSKHDWEQFWITIILIALLAAVLALSAYLDKRAGTRVTIIHRVNGRTVHVTEYHSQVKCLACTKEGHDNKQQTTNNKRNEQRAKN